MNPTNSMYQGYQHAATGIFGFSNGFELRDGGFDSSPPLEEEDSNVLPVYETSGMLSEMFDVPSGIVAVTANASTELFERALPPNYQGHMPAGEAKSNFNHQQLPSINAGSAAAMQLFLMNPQPRSPSSSTSFQGPGGSSFGTSIVPNTVSQPNNPSEIGGVLESQGLSLSLSSSFPHLEVKDGEFLYYNQAHVGLGSSMGMVTVLRNSKYVKDAQELLEEFCSVGRGQLKKNKFGRNKTNPCSNPGGSSLTKDVPHLSSADRIEHQRRKVRLLAMLNEVERRYKLYGEQMKMLVNSLDQAMGNGAAVPYTALAQKAMSRHFRCLKDSISAQLKRSYEVLGEKDGTAGISGTTKGETPELSLRQQRALNQMGGSMMEHEPLRPQRCLPERSVNILRAWLFEHFLHPYPSDADKHQLARQTGLTRNQISNWFINARVRLWKPMVEEMYQQEIKEEDGEGNPNNSSNNAQTSTPSSTTAATVAASTTTAATPAGKTCEISALENDTSPVEINRQCFSFSGKKRKQCSSLTATEVAAPPSSQPFTTTTGGNSLTLGLRHAGNMPDNLQMISCRNFHFSYQF